MLLASSVAVTHRALATVDLVIIGVYFAIVFGIGMYFSLKERSSEDYFLAGRDIGWFFIGASLFVSNISTEHFIGLSGTGASTGLAVGHFEWLACLILLILAGCSCLSTCVAMSSPCRSSWNAVSIGSAPLSGRDLDYRLYLHKDICTALCRECGP